MNTRSSRKSGFTLLEIMIVVSLIGLLFAIAIPNFVRARSVSKQATCISNLRQIRHAIAQWALETKAAGSSSVQFSDIQPYLRSSTVCPAGGTSFADSYDITDVQSPPTCKKVPTGPSSHWEPPDTTQ
jgi:prepilin-type N-terminal cleavage/methylation domain-containing protein